MYISVFTYFLSTMQTSIPPWPKKGGEGALLVLSLFLGFQGVALGFLFLTTVQSLHSRLVVWELPDWWLARWVVIRHFGVVGLVAMDVTGRLFTYIKSCLFMYMFVLSLSLSLSSYRNICMCVCTSLSPSFGYGLGAPASNCNAQWGRVVP